MMKPKYHALLCFLIFLSFGKAFAQPANDTCGTAQLISVGSGTCSSVLYTNVAATTIGNPPTPPCWLPNTMSNTVWFKFVATTADIELSTNFAGTLADTEIAVYSGGCGALTLIGCQEDINTAAGLLHTDVILHGLTPGNTYYAIVDGKGNATGTFGICAQETLPVGPVLPTQDCASSQNLCGLGSISVADGPGGVGNTQENPSCFGAPGERSSNWYSFTAATNGTLCFTINPSTNIDYDFAVYNTSAGCPGTELSCNWSPTSPITGLGCAGGQCNTCLAVFAGQSYSILVDRFTAASTSGFTLDFTGTTTSFVPPIPTFNATTVCLGTATQFTNTTNGNFTYSWNFGDGFTSSLENPTHTYATANTYNVTLLLTSVPGGCQNSTTKVVTVTAPPIVDAGTGGNVCAGSCITLGGSTNAVGSVGLQGFSNTTSYAIPDDSVTGVLSPITVSGIVPAIIDPTSIASVCINLSHTFDADLDISLICPNGTQVDLSSGNGFGADYTGTCFTPTAIIPITSGSSPFSGDFIPEQPLSGFNGCSANGTWQLFVKDDAALDTGSILSWTITFNNNVPPFTWSPTTAMTNATSLTPTVCPTVTTTYTLTANNPGGCTTSDTVTVTVGSGATASISYSAAAYCSSDTPKAVTLTGTGAYTGGVYSSTAGLSIDAAGTITPATSTVGTYTVTYTVPASGGCPAFGVTTSVTIRKQPNAGADGTTTICDSNTTPINLFTLITGEQAGGIWTRTSGTGGTINAATGIFTPVIGTTSSTFNYILTGILPCVNDTSTATVTTIPQPNAGTNGATAVCDSSTIPINLATLISGQQAGGVWTRSGGNGGVFNAAAATYTPAPGATSSTFTYTITGIAPCVTATSTATVTISPVLTPTINCGASTTTSVQFNWASVTGATGYTISYQVNANPVVNVGAIGNVLTYSISSLTAGDSVSITVTPTGAVGTCFAAATLVCTALNCTPPTASISYPAASFCTASGIQAVTLTGTGAYTGGSYSAGSGLTIDAAGNITPATSTAGNYTVTYTIAASAGCAAVSTTVPVTIATPPAAPTLTPTQPTCTVATGSIAITGIAGLTYSFDGSAYSPTLIYSGLAASSSHTVTAQNAAGCISAVANITLNAQPTTPAAPTLTPTQPTCTVATGSVTITGIAGLTYSFDGSAYSSTLIYNGLAAGSSHTVTAQNAAGCISAVANVTLNAQPTTPAAPTLTPTQPTCTVATGSVTITAIAGLTYSFDGSAYSPTLVYSGLAAGSSHAVTAQNAAGCISAVANITLNAQPTTPAPPILTPTQPTCTVATGSVTIIGIAGLTYSFDGSAYSPTLIYSGLAAGSSHTVTAQNAAGCISAVANVTLNAQPTTPAAPSLTPTQPTCTVATGSIAITGIAGLTYSFDGSPYSSTLVYGGLAAGSSHTVTAQNAAGCISTVANVTLNAQPATPAAPTLTPTQPTCTTATGSISITGIAGLTYSFDGSAYSSTLVYGGLAAGSSHTVTAQNAAGCISAVANITLNAQPTTPAPPILTPTQPTCTVATGSVTIIGIAGLTYSFDGSAYSPTLIYSGLAAGSSHTVTAQNAAGCISAVANVTLNAQPTTPAAPTLTPTQPTCTVATGSVTITGIAGLTYSFDGSAYSSTLVYNGLAVGSSHTVTAQNAAGCISAVANITLNAQPATPAAPILTPTQPTCTVATGSVTITGIAGLTYSFDGSTYSSTLIYSGLAAVSSHTVTAQNAGGCISAVANITLNAQPATPAAPTLTPTQPTCTVATGSVTITGIAGLTYSFDGSAYTSNLIYNGLAAGSSHSVTAQNAAGCISATSNITLNLPFGIPTTPIVTPTQPTCTVATGSVSIIGIAGLTYSFDGSAYSSTLVYNGLAAGSSHTVTAQNAAGCISAVANITLNVQPATPAAPTLTPTQPTCTVATGSVTITGIAGLTYSFDGSAYTSNLIYNGLAAASSHSVTAQNAAGCISAVANVTLNAQPATPAAPTLIPTQPTCTVATGSVTITGIAGLTYSFDGSAYSSTLVYNGLAVGSSHTVTAQNAAGCVSAVANITLNAQPTTPAAPTLTPTQPTCTIATGSVNITGIAGLTYSFDGLAYSSTLIYSGLASGSSHNVTAQNAAGCISAVANITLNAQPATPAAPTLTPTQPTCTVATGSVTITGIAGLTYSFDGNVYSSTLIHSGLAAGSSHTVTAKNTVGCISAVSTITLNTQPVTPVAVATPTSQVLCSGNTTGIALSAVPGTTFTWTVLQNNVSGAIAGSGNLISQTLTATGNAAGQAIYTITPFANGCTGLPITVSITVNPLPAATVNPSTQTICSGERANIALASPSGNTSFNWTVTQTGVSGAISGTGNSILQTLTATGIVAGTADYTITPVRNGCNGAAIHAIVTVNPKPQVSNPVLYNICDGDTANIILASTIPATDYTWTVSQSNVIGASNGTGGIINQPLTLTGTNAGIAVYTVTPTANNCQGNPTTLTIKINPLPEPVIKDGTICVEQSSNTTTRTYILDSGLNDLAYDFQWTRDNIVIAGATSSTYEASLSGNYSVIAINSETGCVSQEVFAQITAVFMGDGIVTSVSDAFTGNASIVVTVPIGTGPFRYQLDHGPLQESNVFSGVPGGPHTVYVTDVNGCTDLKQDVTVIDYPKFFTPNGDGYNDTWNIFALKDQQDSRIFIYDRYGKLIKEISPKGTGWDGTYNEHELPATDYWFTVDYNESGIRKTFRSHFSLKR